MNTSSFALARNCTTHLVVQPSDLRLNPPESYLFIQDGLIIACGLLYSLCYLFYSIRTYRDKRCAGPVLCVCGNLSYEFFYALTTTSTTFERTCFLAWLGLDVLFTTTAVVSTYAPGRRRTITIRIFMGFLVGVLALYVLSMTFPDDRQQITAYWTGILLELPVGWVSVYLLLKNQDTRGHSIEIWVTRFLGCLAAYSVFIWRYLNVPENWAYVGSIWRALKPAPSMLPFATLALMATEINTYNYGCGLAICLGHIMALLPGQQIPIRAQVWCTQISRKG
ncbi:hypothetical protein V495_08738 [Pseudogymnoascus sp. VKM F-4514 (FW-929)]|nr:hypothetical protein V495_08738 [Pseudogymnoascus sp. VKM F-4514 (FW-929)]KFY67351.1 hypothetical protein V497_00464 [Pseudogymnoascus sp. VKM F-4516 (FW-969)]